MKVFLFFYLFLSMSFAHSKEGVRQDGFLEKTDEFFGRITNFTRGVHCKDANQAELEAVDCNLSNFTISDANRIKDFEQMIDVLVFSEAAKEVYEINKCQSDFFNSYEAGPEVKEDMENRAFEHFKSVQQTIRKKKSEISKAARLNILENAGSISAGTSTDMVNSVNRQNDRFDKKLEPLIKNIDNLVTSVPMGNRPAMRAYLLSAVDQNLNEVQFKRGFSKTMRELQREANGSYAKMKSLSYPDSGGTGGLLFNVDNQLKRSFVENGLVQSVLVKNKLEKVLEHGLICRYDEKFNVGAMTRLGVEVAGSLLIPYAATSLALRAGLIAARTGSASVRSAAIAAKYLSKSLIFGVNAAQAGITYIDVKQSCYPPEYLASKENENCSPEKQLYEIKAEANIASCLLNATLGVALPIGTGLAAHLGSRAAVNAIENADIIITAPTKTSSKVAERLRRASEVLGTPGEPRHLTYSQNRAIIKAHNVGAAEGRVIGTYTPQDIAQKGRILRQAGFNKSETRVLMEEGITGVEPHTIGSIFEPLPDENTIKLARRTPSEVAADSLKSDEPIELSDLRPIELVDRPGSLQMKSQIDSINARVNQFPPALQYRDDYSLRAESERWFLLERELNPSPPPKGSVSMGERFKSAFTRTRTPQVIQGEMREIEKAVESRLKDIVAQKTVVTDLLDDSIGVRRNLERRLVELESQGVKADPIFLNTPEEVASLNQQIAYLKNVEAQLDLKRMSLNLGIKRAQTVFSEPVTTASRGLIVQENQIVSTINLKSSPDSSDRLLYISEIQRFKTEGIRTDPEFGTILSRWFQDPTGPIEIRIESLFYKWRSGEETLTNLLKNFNSADQIKIMDKLTANPELMDILFADKRGLTGFISFLQRDNRLLEAYGKKLFGNHWAGNQNFLAQIIKADSLSDSVKVIIVEKLQSALKSGKIADYLELQDLVNQSASSLRTVMSNELPIIFAQTSQNQSDFAVSVYQWMASSNQANQQFTQTLLRQNQDPRLLKLPFLREFESLPRQNPEQAAIKYLQTGKASAEFEEAVLSHLMETIDNPVRLYDVLPKSQKALALKALARTRRFNVFERRALEIAGPGDGMEAASRDILKNAPPVSNQFIKADLSVGTEMQATPVTQLQWALVTGKAPSSNAGTKVDMIIDGKTLSLIPNRPVTSISLEDAQGFVKQLNKLDPDYDYFIPEVVDLSKIGVRDAHEPGMVFNQKINETYDVGGEPTGNGFYDLDGNVSFLTSTRWHEEKFTVTGTSYMPNFGYADLPYYSQDHSSHDIGLRLVRGPKKISP